DLRYGLVPSGRPDPASRRWPGPRRGALTAGGSRGHRPGGARLAAGRLAPVGGRPGVDELPPRRAFAGNLSMILGIYAISCPYKSVHKVSRCLTIEITRCYGAATHGAPRVTSGGGGVPPAGGAPSLGRSSAMPRWRWRGGRTGDDDHEPDGNVRL